MKNLIKFYKKFKEQSQKFVKKIVNFDLLIVKTLRCDEILIEFWGNSKKKEKIFSNSRLCLFSYHILASMAHTSLNGQQVFRMLLEFHSKYISNFP